MLPLASPPLEDDDDEEEAECSPSPWPLASSLIAARGTATCCAKESIVQHYESVTAAKVGKNVPLPGANCRESPLRGYLQPFGLRLQPPSVLTIVQTTMTSQRRAS